MPRRKPKPDKIPSDGFKRRQMHAGSNVRFNVRLDNFFYGALKQIAQREKVKIGEICALANIRRQPDVKLTRALRAYILGYFMEAATEDGHRRAGHGVRSP